MGSLKGFEKGFTNSKVASHKVISDSTGNLGLGKFGSNKDTTGVGLASRTRGAIDATSDNDEHGVTGRPATYSLSSAGGASGDGPTPGFDGSGAGVDTLSGAAGNGKC